MSFTWNRMFVTVAVNVGVTIVFCVLFSFLRRLSFLHDYFSPKRRLSIPFRFRPPRLPPTWITWVWPVFNMPSDQFAACAGFDALCYVNFLYLAIRMSLYVTLISMVMCMTTNLTGSFVDRQLALTTLDSREDCELSGEFEDAIVQQGDTSNNCNSFIVTTFDKTAMSNIEAGSRKLVVHVVAVWIITFLVLKMLWDHYHDQVKWRIVYMSSLRKGGTSHTVLVQDIPGTVQGTIVGRVYDNLDTSLGMCLPRWFKEKVRLAMEDGISNVFGKVSESVKGTVDLKPLKRDQAYFTDGKYDKYLLPGEHARGRSFADPDCFQDATSASQLNSSFMSMEEPRIDSPWLLPSKTSGWQSYQVVDSPPSSPLPAHTLLHEHAARGGKANDESLAPAVSSSPPQGSGLPLRQISENTPAGAAAANAERAPSLPPPPKNINGRRNLRNFSQRKAPTDFETWKQADAAMSAQVSVEELVRREFEHSVGKGHVEAVSVVKNEINLGQLVNKYAKKKQDLIDLIDDWTASLRRKVKVKRKQVTVRPNRKDPVHVAKWGDVASVKADILEFKVWELQDLLRKIFAEQESVSQQETSAAFVTLKTRGEATTVAMGMLGYDESYWRTEPAPSPSEVVWHNIFWRSWERNVRNLLNWGLFALLVIFFFPIVTFVQSLINLEVYATPVGVEPENFVRRMLNSNLLGGVLGSVMPTLALRICIQIVPIVLRMLSEIVGGLPSKSAIDFDSGRRFFVFQVIVLFFQVTIIGAMLSGGSDVSGGGGSDPAVNATAIDSTISQVTIGDQLAMAPVPGPAEVADPPVSAPRPPSVLDVGDSFKPNNIQLVQLFQVLRNDPQQIPTWLGTSLPQQASFFIMYILTNGLFARGFAFLRLPGAAIYVVLSRLAATARQKKRLWSQQYMSYGDDVPEHTMCLLLMLVFCVVQPFVPLMALVYFIFNYIYSRYDLLYVKRERYQSGGLFWPVIFDQIYTGLIIFLVGITALFAVKGFGSGASACVPLIIIAIIYRGVVSSMFERPMKMLSMHAAADLDEADKTYNWMRDLTAKEEAEMKQQGWDLEGERFGPVEERYLQPSLLRDQEAHDRVISEAQDISEKVNDFNAGRAVQEQDFMLHRSRSGSDAASTQQLSTEDSGGAIGLPVLSIGNVPEFRRMASMNP